MRCVEHLLAAVALITRPDKLLDAATEQVAAASGRFALEGTEHMLFVRLNWQVVGLHEQWETVHVADGDYFVDGVGVRLDWDFRLHVCRFEDGCGQGLTSGHK